jgi:hypothetical protein
MEYDRGPFRHYGWQRAEHLRKRYQDRMKNYRSVLDERMSAAPWIVSRLTEHVADAFLFITRVRQARDLHDVLSAQSAFVQKKIDMFAGGAKALTDAVAMASPPSSSGTLVGGQVALAQWRKRAENIARISPEYVAKSTMREGVTRYWTAVQAGAERR